MSIEKNLAGNTDVNTSNSDAVQVNPELPNEQSETTNNSPSIETEPAAEPIAAEIEPKEEVSDTTMNESTKDTSESISNENDEIKVEENSNEDTSQDAELSSIQEPNSTPIEGEKEIDYQLLSKEELLKHIAEIADNFTIKKAGHPTNQIKDTFNAIIKEEGNIALNKFIEDGGVKEDFKFQSGNEKSKFDAYYKIIKEKRHQHYKSLEKDKDQNLILKNELLEKLRKIVDNEESSSINELKKLQEEWKTVGPIQPQYNSTLWANYHALLDRFYDHRSIYFELKDLDRKKNLTTKIELVNKAEALDQEENLNTAIKKLNDLHEEFKHIGPVPREEQENLWQKFKAASDVVYSKRKEYTAELVTQLKENLVKKLELVEEINATLSFTSEKPGEWNTKTKEILDFQKKWESIGGMPRENAKEVNKKFWSHFKQFYQNKNVFFKSLDSQREANLEIKQALIDKAIELKDNQDWEKTSNALIKLQNEWKESGPVPDKVRNEIYKKFKAACDTFFDNRRDHNKGQEAEYEVNLTKKEEVCTQLESMVSSDILEPEKIYGLQSAFNSLGFVPRKAIKKIQNKYKNALQALLEKAKGLSEDDYETFKNALAINDMRSGPDADKKIQRQEYTMKRKITNLENDVATWKNNLGFFANSKNATELLKDFEQKIKDAEQNIGKLKAELKLVMQA